MNKKKNTYSIPPSTGRRFAFGDIHGCYNTLQALLQKIKATDDDQLFFLGDMIDRGKYSQQVIDFMIESKALGKQYYCLRGNHEEYLINTVCGSVTKTKSQEFITKNGLQFLFNEKDEMKPDYYQFFSQLPYYFELPKHYLVHAGLNFIGNPLENIDDMLTIREMNPDLEFLNGKKVINAHTPVDLNEVYEAIVSDSPVINIDNGCVFGTKFPFKGNLVCIDLDSYKVYHQKNIDL